MEQLNKVQLRGRVGNVRTNAVGDRQAYHFSVATNYVYRNQEGNIVEETTWHNCTYWGNKKNVDLSFIKTGTAVDVTGRIKTGKYIGTDGVERYSYDVVAYELSQIPDDEPLKSESSI